MSRSSRAVQPGTVLTSGQRRMVLGFLAAGLTCLVVGLAVPPHGAAFWLALVLGPLALGILAAMLGGGPGRALESRLLDTEPKPAWQPPAATALPDPARTALGTAAVPALLAELAGKSIRASARPVAQRLLEAFVAAWNSATDDGARTALARELPGLVAGLLEGDASGIRAAEDAASRLAQPAGGPR